MDDGFCFGRDKKAGAAGKESGFWSFGEGLIIGSGVGVQKVTPVV